MRRAIVWLSASLLSVAALAGSAQAANRQPDATLTVTFAATGTQLPMGEARRVAAFAKAQPLGTTFRVQAARSSTGDARRTLQLVAARGRATATAIRAQGLFIVTVGTPLAVGAVAPSSPAARHVLIQAYRPQVIAQQVAVTFDGNGGSSPASVTFTIGSPALTLPTPEPRRGYAFLGWSSAAAGGTFVGAAGTAYTPIADVTLYGQWRQLTTTIHVRIDQLDPYRIKPGYIDGCLDSCTVTVIPRLPGVTQLPGPVFDGSVRMLVGETLTVTLATEYFTMNGFTGADCAQRWIGAGPSATYEVRCTGFREGVPASLDIGWVQH